MSIKPDSDTIYKSGDEVIAELTAIQKADRLAIHVWEKHQPNYRVPSILKTLEEHSEAFSEQLKNNKVNLTSLTLLPQPGKSVRPYNVNYKTINRPTYLFNLSKHEKESPKIIKVFRDMPYTGYDADNKDLLMQHTFGVPLSLKPFYQGLDDRGIKKRIANNHDNTLSNFQLDALAENMHNDSSVPLNTNEVIALVNQEHLNAICLPHYCEKQDNELAHYNTLLQLEGCLHGILHLKQTPPIDLPVVNYHVTSPHMGEFTYVGQGKEMLTDLAFKALLDLPKNQPQVFLTDFQKLELQKAVKHLLNIDINEPLLEQDAYKAWNMDMLKRSRIAPVSAKNQSSKIQSIVR